MFLTSLHKRGTDSSCGPKGLGFPDLGFAALELRVRGLTSSAQAVWGLRFRSLGASGPELMVWGLRQKSCRNLLCAGRITYFAGYGPNPKP